MSKRGGLSSLAFWIAAAVALCALAPDAVATTLLKTPASVWGAAVTAGMMLVTGGGDRR